MATEPIRRVLTGMRTTGRLHLGHYIGALLQWLAVQDEGYECFFLLADMQALTTHADQPEMLAQSVRDVVLDWLAVGLDPTRSNVHFVQQSQVAERSHLSMLFQMIARYGEVMRNPTLKEELERQPNATVGFMTYPVDQVADIYMVSPMPWKRNNELLIPVGEDQVPHLEFAREMARRFNRMYDRHVFTPCRTHVGPVGRLVGTDGKAKMSKSLGNVIELADPSREVERKVMGMYTDPSRIRATDPGETTNNPVFIYHRAFNPDKAMVADLTERYQKGRVGDVEVKRLLAEALNDMLEPMRERRAEFENIDLSGIVYHGTARAREICRDVVAAAQEAMHLRIPK